MSDNFPNNPLKRYKALGDLFAPDWMNQLLGTYIIGDEKSVFYIWLWSVNHFLSGMFLAVVLRHYTTLTLEQRYMVGFQLHNLWELLQIVVENTELSTLRGQIDLIMDTIIFMVGMVIVEEYYTF